MTTRPKADPVGKLMKEIVLGRHDDDLGRLTEAILARAEDAARPRWRVNLPDLELTEDDLTVGEACDIEEAMLGTVVGRDKDGRPIFASWLTIDPRRSAEECQTVLTILYRHRLNLTAAEAQDRARQLNARQLRAAVKMEIVPSEAAPFDESILPPDT